MAAYRRVHAVLERPLLGLSGLRLPPLESTRLLPSWRSLALGFGVVSIALLGYVGVRSSSVFAIRTVDVRGLPPRDAAQVRAALAPLVGTSLVRLRRDELDGPLAAVPGVRGFTYDRAFPNTLRVVARPELPVAVLRRGPESWLVSSRGRVLRRLQRRAVPALPRIWVTRQADVRPGLVLEPDLGGTAARALALLGRLDFPAPARTVRTEGELTYIFRTGLELRLGTARDEELKLAAAALILPALTSDVDYLDVSLPERPVAGTTLNQEVEVEG